MAFRAKFLLIQRPFAGDSPGPKLAVGVEKGGVEDRSRDRR
jgi:hypothetical protein